MPAYNFQARFALKVLDGSKLSTIRGREAKVGSTAYLFTGMRTKACQRLGCGEIVYCAPITLGYDRDGEPFAMLDKQRLSKAEFDQLAMDDGFAYPREMLAWFKSTYDTETPVVFADGSRIVFEGFLIIWEIKV